MAKPTVKLWSQGQTVRSLQQALNQVLAFLPPPLAEDGMFGPKTLARVREFQKRTSLTVDGVMGPHSWNTMEMVLAGTLTLFGQALASGAQLIEESPFRNAIAKVAHDEWMNYGVTIHAKNSGGSAPPLPGSTKPRHYRGGHQRLLEYFRTSAPDPTNPARPTSTMTR
jgi:peptidoglycan hydrolase-like protein with peptidoglycan-binding domain